VKSKKEQEEQERLPEVDLHSDRQLMQRDQQRILWSAED
jgi:hypothetical protein